MVDEKSATIGLKNEETIPMDADHSTICKFGDADDNQLGRVIGGLRDIIKAIAPIGRM